MPPEPSKPQWRCLFVAESALGVFGQPRSVALGSCTFPIYWPGRVTGFLKPIVSTQCCRQRWSAFVTEVVLSLVSLTNRDSPAQERALWLMEKSQLNSKVRMCRRRRNLAIGHEF